MAFRAYSRPLIIQEVCLGVPDFGGPPNEIVRYLRKRWPAEGTTDSAEVQSFVALVESWDEGLWNYGTLEGAFPSSNLIPRFNPNPNPNPKPSS